MHCIRHDSDKNLTEYEYMYFVVIGNAKHRSYRDLQSTGLFIILNSSTFNRLGASCRASPCDGTLTHIMMRYANGPLHQLEI